MLLTANLGVELERVQQDNWQLSVLKTEHLTSDDTPHLFHRKLTYLHNQNGVTSTNRSVDLYFYIITYLRVNKERA